MLKDTGYPCLERTEIYLRAVPTAIKKRNKATSDINRHLSWQYKITDDIMKFPTGMHVRSVAVVFYRATPASLSLVLSFSIPSQR